MKHNQYAKMKNNKYPKLELDKETVSKGGTIQVAIGTIVKASVEISKALSKSHKK